jgi:peptidyl-prolyl cis-trans isomerase B (cyclophilin B)
MTKCHFAMGLYPGRIDQYHDASNPVHREQGMKSLLHIVILLLLTVSVAHAQDNGPYPEVTIHTNRGDIRVELYPDKAPVTVENFLQYARDGFYDETIFHRVISHFMIQGGGLTNDMNRKPTRDPIVNEADNGLKNVRGSIAMARTNDPNSATSQFFINVELNVSLDHVGKTDSRSWGYAVFGKVIDGMDVVDDIRFVETDQRDVPLMPVFINSVEIH